MNLKDLEPFLEKIVKIERIKEIPINPTDSYLGGYPFVPETDKNWTWPATLEDEPLVFICQINFKDIPKGYEYPKAGLLQIFVDLNAYETMLKGGGLRVIFYNEKDLNSESISKPSDSGPIIEDWTPFDEDHSPNKMTFTEAFQISDELFFYAENYKSEEKFTPGDYKEKVIKLHQLLVENGGSLPKELNYLVEERHQLGGEPQWVQGPMLEADQNPTFMLQINSDYDDYFMMFGDAGNMHVFGSLEKLREGDVSDFFWEWSCY